MQTFKIDLANTKMVMDSPAGQQVRPVPCVELGPSHVVPGGACWLTVPHTLFCSSRPPKFRRSCSKASSWPARAASSRQPMWPSCSQVGGWCVVHSCSQSCSPGPAMLLWVGCLPSFPPKPGNCNNATLLCSRLRRHPCGREHREAGGPRGGSEDAAGAALGLGSSLVFDYACPSSPVSVYTLFHQLNLPNHGGNPNHACRSKYCSLIWSLRRDR